MHINQEKNAQNAIQAYSESQVKINEIIYEHNIVIKPHGEPEIWTLDNLAELDEDKLHVLMEGRPEIILIGHTGIGKNQFAPMAIRQYLANNRIGFETLSIGAACRTFNVLLAEDRAVVMGILF